MVRTVIWYGYFWLFMLFSPLLTIPLLVLSLPSLGKRRKQYLHAIVSGWAKSLLYIAGAQVHVKGLDTVPRHGRICYIANHQGSFDIPLTLAHLPGPPGFIAKEELTKLPIVSLWMKAIGCIFIQRGNRRAAVEVIQHGVEAISQGQSLIIFPEGTRSRSPALNPFKPGSLKLPIRSKATIIPVSIAGSYKLLEEKGRITPARVVMTIHPPIESTSFDDDATRQLGQLLQETISQAVLPNN